MTHVAIVRRRFSACDSPPPRRNAIFSLLRHFHVARQRRSHAGTAIAKDSTVEFSVRRLNLGKAVKEAD